MVREKMKPLGKKGEFPVGYKGKKITLRVMELPDSDREAKWDLQPWTIPVHAWRRPWASCFDLEQECGLSSPEIPSALRLSLIPALYGDIEGEKGYIWLSSSLWPRSIGSHLSLNTCG